ncbi:hypothetical protein C7S15_3211 [Burkholderia cepacia]|uniref:hypothetical protein n=1 Tax=Burkholderia cepacia TaxID=292 RepID=UPI00299001A8|nr:hypothetical protein [Burkholderia cepacia]MDW9228614.1 hypothetical protein [Burkholderia cepacia]
MEELEQEKSAKEKSKFEKDHVKISVFLRKDQVEYLNKEHVEPNSANMSLVVRSAVDVFIEKEKKQKLTALKRIFGDEVYEQLVQLSIACGKEIDQTMIELIRLNCEPEKQDQQTEQEPIDQFAWNSSAG